MNLIFDIDDTLYDQIEPFKKAYEKNFSYDVLVSDLFVCSRKYSDEVFELTQNNEMSTSDMHIYRITKAFEFYNISISKEEAMKFQRDYEFFQNHISLSKEMEQILSYCKDNNVKLGVISNGISTHQWNKVSNLGILKWIDKSDIIISADVEVSKPNRKIFQICESKLGIRGEEIYYIGDSFENDVIGSINSGWRSIWFNKRKNIRDTKGMDDLIIVEDEKGLFATIKELCNKER